MAATKAAQAAKTSQATKKTATTAKTAKTANTTKTAKTVATAKTVKPAKTVKTAKTVKQAAPVQSAKNAPAKAAKAAKPRQGAAVLAVGTGEKPWTARELAAVRAELDDDTSRLQAQLDEAEADLAEMLADVGDSAGDDQADAGSKTFEREHEMSLANNAREMLAQVERAVQRIGAGTYGLCETCGNPIGKARLQAFPRATQCLVCKHREERR